MFSLSDQSLNVEVLRAQMLDGRAGALATFEGRVRNHNDGKQVHQLEYEAYDELAVKTADIVMAEARARFDIYDCSCTHRVGSLKIGDLAVWVGVIAAHREAAFAACRYIIDEIKHRVPIWKKEHYSEGAAQWVNCPSEHGQKPASDLAEPDREALYSRQMILPQIGRAGQNRLKQSKLLVVGAGGLGSAAIMYLAAAGVGKLVICDKDKVEISNLHRQVLFGMADVGCGKAKTAADVIAHRYPFVETAAVELELTIQNVDSIIAGFDLVLDCSDNFDTSLVLNDACIAATIPLLRANVHQYEGQLSMRLPDGKGQCLRCLWPTKPRADHVESCADVGMLGPVVGVVGSIQAVEAIKFICDIPSDLTCHVLLFNLLTFELTKIKRKELEGCTVCGAVPAGINVDNFDFSVPAGQSCEWELDILDLSGSELKSFQIVDIREPEEDPAQLLRALLRHELINLPLSKLDLAEPQLVSGTKYLFVCQKGLRSGKLVADLRARGFKNTFSLLGGVESVRRKFIA